MVSNISRSPLVCAAMTGVMLMLGLAQPAAAFESKAREAIVFEPASDTVLFAKNADKEMVPSSMTKLMTIYILFDRMKHGVLKKDDSFTVSEKAWKKGGSKMFVNVGQNVLVEDLIRGIIVQSGNDACIVVAEGISGSEEAFAQEMNKVGEKLGLQASHFKNSTGWPDEGHVMSARDLAVLSQRLVEDFPEYYPYFAETNFTYANIKQYNRNKLLEQNLGVDGLKTGHTAAGGYGIAVSAERDGRRLYVVVNGLDGQTARELEAERLLNYGFREFMIAQPFQPGVVIGEVDAWLGKQTKVKVTVQEHDMMSIPLRKREEIQMALRYDGPVAAPIEKGQEVGVLLMKVPGMEAREIPVVALEDVAAVGFGQRICQSFLHWLVSAE